MDKKECAVCYDEVPGGMIVDCSSCDALVCKQCAKKWLLMNPSSPSCSMCNNKWTYKFIASIFKKAWLVSNEKDGYRNMRKNLYHEREKSLILSTMPEAEITKEKNILKSKINKLKNEIYKYQQELGVLEENTEKKVNYLCPCPYSCSKHSDCYSCKHSSKTCMKSNKQ